VKYIVRIKVVSDDRPGLVVGKGSGQGTFSGGINPAGTVMGASMDANSVNHGFVRDKHGVLTTFDAPGAGTGIGQGTFPATPNPASAITGWYIDSSNVFHGFLLEGE
jgi:hypothetical protein